MLAAPTLRVLYVVHGFPPDTWAGTEIYTLELAQEMKRRGHDVAVLTRAPDGTPDSDGASADFSVELREFRGLPVWRLTHRLQHQRLRDSYHQPRVDAAFRTLLAEIRPDVVHFQHLIHLSAGLPLICREHGVPSLLTVNDYWALCARVQLIRPDGVRCEENQGLGCLLCVKERSYDRIASARRVLPALLPIARAIRPLHGSPGLQRLADRAGELCDIADRHDFVCDAYASCDVLLTPSRFIRQKLLESGKFDPDRLVYSDYGMRVNSPEGFARVPRNDVRLRFGFVGSLLWYKGIDLLLRAMRQLDPDRAVLNVFGDFVPERDEYHASLARLAADCGRSVVFHGRFDNNDLALVYEQIDVLVVPSTWFENSPLSIHEAFLFQTPVVTSDIGGMAELVRDGANGLHFRAGDAADLARALGRFVAEPALAASLAAFPRIKTMEEDARETETRYRAAACVVRDRP
jgi:glycosyltransferase involved in cell wall biosynthesis